MDQEEVRKIIVGKKRQQVAMKRLDKRLRLLQEDLNKPVEVRRKEQEHFSESQSHSSNADEGLPWLVKLIKDPQSVSWTEKMKLRPQDTTDLLNKVENGSQKERKKALALLGRIRGIPIRTLCFVLDTSPSTIGKDRQRLKEGGVKSVFQGRKPHNQKQKMSQ
jgi:hypothetical protein